MEISQVGRELIERNEGLRLKAYPDPATGGDPWTIGYGDTGPDVVSGLVITKEEADERLTKRLNQEFGKIVNQMIGDSPTTQGQFDAMVSLAYNIGVGNFEKSSVIRDHVNGNYRAAADDFLKWNRAAGRVLDGLTRRREEERNLYLSNIELVPISEVTTPGKNNDNSNLEQNRVLRLTSPMMYGDDVRNLQSKLGNDPSQVDGIFGKQTEEMVRNFQRARGIFDDGIFGPVTRAMLDLQNK